MPDFLAFEAIEDLDIVAARGESQDTPRLRPDRGRRHKMSALQSDLFATKRSIDEAISETIDSLKTYGPHYRHWAIAFSGGKDSAALVSLVCWLLATHQVVSPESLTILYANTRQELPSLHEGAITLGQFCETYGRQHGLNIRFQCVEPEIDYRFLVYILGRGVPPPSNVFRWCTRRLKQRPMHLHLSQMHQELGERFLMLTGVRIGESAARDARISASCSKDDGECGQGWFQTQTDESVADTLAPILHWRVCHIANDWLPTAELEYGFPVWHVLDTYGFNSQDENTDLISTRTGCFGCPLVQEDGALLNLSARDDYAHLRPLNRLRDLYWEYHGPEYRIRKFGERNKDGKLAKNQGRLGPLTMEARESLEAKILDIQAESHALSVARGKPLTWLLPPQDLERIREMRANNVWPDKWTGELTSPIEFACMIRSFNGVLPENFGGCEISGLVPYPKVNKDGTFTVDLFWEGA